MRLLASYKTSFSFSSSGKTAPNVPEQSVSGVVFPAGRGGGVRRPEEGPAAHAAAARLLQHEAEHPRALVQLRRAHQRARTRARLLQVAARRGVSSRAACGLVSDGLFEFFLHFSIYLALGLPPLPHLSYFILSLDRIFSSFDCFSFLGL